MKRGFPLLVILISILLLNAGDKLTLSNNDICGFSATPSNSYENKKEKDFQRKDPSNFDISKTSITESQLVRDLESFLEDISRKDEFSGVVLLAKDDKPIFHKAYGYASKEYKFPNNIKTRFNIGSINKFITRIAIEQLEVSGKLKLDDPIGKYLPDYPNKEAREKVSIRHLLEMSSGIGDFFGEKYQSTPKDKLRNLSDYLPLFADEPLLFEPGTKTKYSNGGYIVLGLIIEKLSGKSYFDYVKENVYKIAGMENTDHFEADLPVENVASGYTRFWNGKEHLNEPRRNNIYTRPAQGSSAGGGYSTAEDLLKLIIALKNNKLSAPKVSREIIENSIAIAGGAPGISAIVETFPKKGFTLIVLSNYDPPIAEKVGDKIKDLLARLN